MEKKNIICIIDCGSQYCKVIDRKLREYGYETTIKNPNNSTKKLNKFGGIIISGSPSSTNSENIIGKKIFDNLQIPALGICYGAQLLNHYYGGKNNKLNSREDGQININIANTSPIFEDIEFPQKVLLTHGDIIENLGENIEAIAISENNFISAIQHKLMPQYGLQFHPEVDLTYCGKKIFENFAKKCGIEKTRNTNNILANLIEELQIYKNNIVVVLLSGGVDSAVCFALLSKVIPKERLYGIHIDNGFMRKNESQIVYNDLIKLGGENIQIIDAGKEFIGAIIGIINPEEKRKIIGNKFMEIAEREIRKIGEKILLAQGTLRPDLIESANNKISSGANIIKTHHNDTNIVREMRENGLIIEPLKDLHKDEVRKLAIKLGLSTKIANRHPFPGPGLAIRILANNNIHCNCNKEIDEYKILHINSVGVQGDMRTYAHVAVINSPRNSINYLCENYDEIFSKVIKITNKYDFINRVVYSLTNVEEFELINLQISNNTIAILREIDHIINNIIEDSGIYNEISQMPIILIPIGKNNKPSVVIRPFLTNDFMTGEVYKLSHDILHEIQKKIMDTKLISNIFYDLTSKPPGTTEWE